MDRLTELLESCRAQNARLIEDNKQLRAELAALRAERDALRAAVQKAVPALEDMGDAFARMAHPTLSSIVSEQLIGLRAALGER